MNENMEFPDMSGEDIEWLQDSFVKVIFGRIEESLANRRLKKEDAGKVGKFGKSGELTTMGQTFPRRPHFSRGVWFLMLVQRLTLQKRITLVSDKMAGSTRPKRAFFQIMLARFSFSHR